MPISRDRPLKQNIRVWFNYLKTALRNKYKVNKEYYKSWHLTKVKSLNFDKWWVGHKHLFHEKEYVKVSVLNSLSYNEAIKQVKEQLIDKVGKTSHYQMTNKRFRYLEVDDYLKCWILRNEKSLTYNDIGYKIHRDYKRKQDYYTKHHRNVIRRKFTIKDVDEYYSEQNSEILLQIVRRKVLNAEQILKNTAKGQFTGKY